MKGVYSGGGTKKFDNGTWGYEIQLYCSYHGRDFTTITRQGLSMDDANKLSSEIHREVDKGNANYYFGQYECPVCKPLCNDCYSLQARKEETLKYWKETEAKR